VRVQLTCDLCGIGRHLSHHTQRLPRPGRVSEPDVVHWQRTVFAAASRQVTMEILRLASLTHVHPLSMRQLADLAPYAAELTVRAGHRLLLDGPFAQELVLVGAGRGRVRCAGEAVAELGPGDVFGALRPQRTTYPTATVTAISDLRLVMFSTRDIRLLRSSAPEAIAALLDACALAPWSRAEIPRLALTQAAAA
jgi:CRP-like cAMP-binding protein